MKFQANKGHLSHGSLHLKQNEKTMQQKLKSERRVNHLKSLPKPVLDWKQHN